MENFLQNKTCWVLTEGLAGTENQCIGVAEALGLKPQIKRVKLREPWKTLSPHIGFESWWSFDPLLFAPWPDILIASGRKSIAASRYIKRLTYGETFTVQLQDPRVSADQFDLVAVPQHDPLRGSNVIVTTATPNRITAERLKRESIRFKKQFAALPSPKIAVLIGGNSKTHKMTESSIAAIIQTLKSLEGGLMITVSRRTPPPFEAMLRKALQGDHIHFWDGTGENPYFGMLGLADYIFVTNDSASMLSEAATSGKPVYILPLEGGSPKFDSLYDALKKRDAVRDYLGKLEKWRYEPLNDATLVAKAVENAMIEKFKADNTGETG
ncbi:MAG: mitochondrial fission ELM1 family protein [Alphaproteobacteria bacterium]